MRERGSGFVADAAAGGGGGGRTNGKEVGGDEKEEEEEEEQEDYSELMSSLIEGVGDMTIAMSMDSAGRWRIARGQLKE